MSYLRAGGKWLACGLVVVASLLPRLWHLGRFITVDENLRLDYPRQFLAGLASGDLSLTFGPGYPGVPVAWANSLGLLALFILSRAGLAPRFPPGLSLEQFLAGLDIDSLPYFVAARTGTVVLVAVLLLLVYILGRHLFGSKVALLSALLLAFDPSMLGSHAWCTWPCPWRC